MNRAVLFIAIVTAATLSSGLAAQSEVARQSIAAADARAVVAEVRRQIGAHYVLAGKRPAIDQALSRALEAGRYEVSEPRMLAERLTADLFAASHDKHLNMSFDPRRAAMIEGQTGDEVRSGPAWERDAQMRNHGIITMRMIPGNIRYLAYDGFVWTGPKSAAAIDNAMAFLSEGDVAIIDLTANGGGSPLAVQYLISHFMEPGRPLVTFHMGGRSEPDRRSTHANVPNRMVGKPLYVLTSRHTGSAAEEFVGHVAGFRLGEVVGETTGGAAFRNDLFNAGHGFVLSVSVGRPVLAATGTDWEGQGIAPTIAVAADKALDAALAHALRKLAANASPQDRLQFERRAEILTARVTPPAPALPLSAYVGSYGMRSVKLEDGKLVYRREGGITSPLLPLGRNLFALDLSPETRIEFTVEGGTVVSFDLIQEDGARTSVVRS